MKLTARLLLICAGIFIAFAGSDRPANGQAPEAETPAVPEGWCDLHQIAMERRSNARGSWWSHWLASDKRYCKGKA